METIEFRASLVIGTGSLSFDLVKSLTDRLPVMLCPRWLTTATQPIAVDDVLAYLLAAKDSSRREPDLRDRQPGCHDLWRHDSGIRSPEGITAMADIGASADAIPVEHGSPS